MATTSSVPPTAIDRSSSRRAQPQSTPSRAQSTRTRAPAAAPVTASSGQANPTHHRSSSSRHRAGDEIPPHSDYDADYETSNVTDASRRSSSRDPSAAQHAESGRGELGRGASGHQRPSSRYSANMPSHAANSGGPAPVVAPTETKHKASGKSRTTIPAQTGNWVLGKTIGAGSMGKVKLARRAEGGEQVCI